MLCVDGFKQYCHLVFTGIMIDYEEQILITRIKSNR